MVEAEFNSVHFRLAILRNMGEMRNCKIAKAMHIFLIGFLTSEGLTLELGGCLPCVLKLKYNYCIVCESHIFSKCT